MQIRSREDWHRVLLEYQPSKETVSSYCKRHQIGESSFYYWRTKINPKKPDSIKMLPVVSSEIKPIDMVEFIFPKGMCLRFSAGASPRYIADIIKALI